MSLLAEIAAEVTGPGPKGCALATFRAGLEEADRADFDAAMADADRYTTSAIHRAIRARGFVGSVETVKRHRRGECRCR